ncbi:MAG: amidohydrolase family protein [Patulibacter sp.]
MSAPEEVIDFHGHWFPPELASVQPAGLPPAVAGAWPLMRDLDRQLELAGQAGTDIKVVNAVWSSIAPVATVPAAQLAARVNDALALAVADHGPRVVALATVDAFAGDAAAEEARRAVEQLGLAGIVVDAAQGELLLSAPQARPVLEYAAQAGVAVFAHPVNPPVLPPRYADQRHAGVLLARGAESALSTLAILDAGLLDELPALNLVLAGIGGAALLLAPFLPEHAAASRARLHIDTMGFDPAAARFALDALGAERVLVGSDWPIIDRDAGRARVGALLDQLPLDAHGRGLVAAGNARRLLRLPVPAAS